MISKGRDRKRGYPREKEIAQKECKNRKQKYVTHVQKMVWSLVWLEDKLVTNGES